MWGDSLNFEGRKLGYTSGILLIQKFEIMGVIISVVVAEASFVVTGVLSSLAASKSSGQGLKYSAISAAISFLAFLIILIITIFLG